MEKLFTYYFEARGRPVSRHVNALERSLSGATPWLRDLAAPHEPQPPVGRFGFTLWGSNEPWNSILGLSKVADLSTVDTLQLPHLEPLFPLAMRHIIRLRRTRQLGHQLPWQAKRELTVLFPAINASWHDESVSWPLGSDHERLNKVGYREAKTLALVIPRGRHLKPWLGAGYLFPIDARGQDVPRGPNETVLEIHR